MYVCVCVCVVVYSLLSLKEMDTARPVQILVDVVCLSNNRNTFAKGMNPIILLQAMGK